MIWCCPACRGSLRADGDTLICTGCERRYATVEGIPDLRIDAPSWIDLDEDREQARRVARVAHELPLEALVQHVFQTVRGLDERHAAGRTQEVVGGHRKLAPEITGWLDEVTRSGPFLDLGCGAGQLLAASGAAGRPGIGLDVSLVWLVVAKRLLEEHRITPVLAAGFAEALPIADDTLRGVVSLDVIEHVGDQVAYLREIDRVLAPGGVVALATPNRYSLAAEPHVGVWGVGWLPRRWQRRYAERRSGISYAYTRLLSTFELRRLLAAETHLSPTFIAPPIPRENIVRSSPRRATLARSYNRLVSSSLGAQAALAVGAYYRVVARKEG